MTKLLDFNPGDTVIIACWGSGREVLIVAHDDCGLTTLQNLRTKSTWTMSSHTTCRTVQEEIDRRHLALNKGVTHYHGAKLGAAEWYGWRDGKRLERAAELREFARKTRAH